MFSHLAPLLVEVSMVLEGLEKLCTSSQLTAQELKSALEESTSITGKVGGVREGRRRERHIGKHALAI